MRKQQLEFFKDQFDFYWTGKVPDKFQNRRDIPKNIKFTGYIPYENYIQLMSQAFAVMALTTEDDCLQCASYESIGLNIPCILSDTKAQRDFFEDICIYTSIESNVIIVAIKNMIRQRNAIMKRIDEFKRIQNKNFDKAVFRLYEMIHSKNS